MGKCRDCKSKNVEFSKLPEYKPLVIILVCILMLYIFCLYGFFLGFEIGGALKDEWRHFLLIPTGGLLFYSGALIERHKKHLKVEK